MLITPLYFNISSQTCDSDAKIKHDILMEMVGNLLHRNNLGDIYKVILLSKQLKFMADLLRQRPVANHRGRFFLEKS